MRSVDTCAHTGEQLVSNNRRQVTSSSPAQTKESSGSHTYAPACERKRGPAVCRSVLFDRRETGDLSVNSSVYGTGDSRSVDMGRNRAGVGGTSEWCWNALTQAWSRCRR
jgi:hypothetical protein